MIRVEVICKFFGRTTTISSAVAVAVSIVISTARLNLSWWDLPRIPWGEEGTVFAEEFQIFDKALKNEFFLLMVIDFSIPCGLLQVGIQLAVTNFGDDALPFDVEVR
ncbi:hypothetical protein PEDI_55720 [Persicobacter diffluens]|uniref:Uncharacterized protein n=2 Tax=Persicobacter diffluens TaxID=981 RepID=A0AAN5AMF4_9BACT|nr:hypothetical protein PEDI_55720 [Persicobacter diffluens]